MITKRSSRFGVVFFVISGVFSTNLSAQEADFFSTPNSYRERAAGYLELYESQMRQSVIFRNVDIGEALRIRESTRRNLTGSASFDTARVFYEFRPSGGYNFKLNYEEGTQEYYQGKDLGNFAYGLSMETVWRSSEMARQIAVRSGGGLDLGQALLNGVEGFFRTTAIILLDIDDPFTINYSSDPRYIFSISIEAGPQLNRYSHLDFSFTEDLGHFFGTGVLLWENPLGFYPYGDNDLRAPLMTSSGIEFGKFIDEMRRTQSEEHFHSFLRDLNFFEEDDVSE